MEKIGIAFEEIRSLADNLGFQADIENSAAEIRAGMSLHWADLSGKHSYDLKGFGQVNPELAGRLNGSIDRLAKIAMELSRLFS